MPKKSKTVKELINKFTNVELHNLAIIVRSWDNDKQEFSEVYDADTPKEVLLKSGDILGDAMFSTADSIMEKLEGINNKEATAFVNELLSNIDDYIMERDDD